MHDIYQAQIIAISRGPEAKNFQGIVFWGGESSWFFSHVHSSTDVPSHNYWRIDSTVIINETTNQNEALLVSNKRNDPSFYPFTAAVGNNLEKIRNHIETYTILTVIAFLPFSPVFHEPPGNHTAGLGYYKLMFNIFVLNGSQKSRVHWDRNATGREGVWFFFRNMLPDVKLFLKWTVHSRKEEEKRWDEWC